MKSKLHKWSKRLVPLAVLAGSSGFLFSSSCSNSDVEALAAGVQAFADAQARNNNLSFTDWLLSQLQN
ncbi:MAG: hypothetical protein D6788_11580 [Planctomycetota bacterium]|nr:MAG: hypothetical protein D6788_11580 [Planctomycetota bacterium]